MKNILFFVAAAAVMFVSCQKSLNETDSNRREIRLGLSAIGYETKSFVESTNSNLQSNGFKAAAVIDDGNSTIFNKAVAYSNGAYSVSGEHFYFPNEGTVSFYGVYPADKVITIADDGKASIVYAHNSDDDLIGAKKCDVSSQNDAVAMDFDHLLSQVVINAKTDESNVVCKVYSITIRDANGGTYNFADGRWTLSNTKVDYSYFTSTSGQVITTSSSAVGSAMSFMPDEVKLNTKWKCYNKIGGQMISSNDVTIPVMLTKGKRTTINLLLPAKSSEMAVSSSVKSWNDENQNFTVEPPFVPELLTGVFTVNTNKKVKFTKGNLFWNGTTFLCEGSQYDYPTAWDANHVGHFFWSKNARVAYSNNYDTANKSYGITPTIGDKFFAADGGVIEGYTVLSNTEWEYLINNALAKNSSSENQITIAGKVCIVLKPDNFSGTVANKYTADEWAAAESTFGLVALPIAGSRSGTTLEDAGNHGYSYYWASSPADIVEDAYFARFYAYGAGKDYGGRHNGYCIRLVKVQ